MAPARDVDLDLTPRQLAVLALVVEIGAKEAACRLLLSGWTVKAHLREARRRAGCETTLQLVAWCDDNVPGWRERRPAA